MKNIYTERCRYAPIDKEPQADVSVEIEFVIRIIPPSHMEGVIENYACYEFYYRTGGGHSEKDHEEIAAERLKDPDGGIKAQAIYRT